MKALCKGLIFFAVVQLGGSAIASEENNEIEPVSIYHAGYKFHKDNPMYKKGTDYDFIIEDLKKRNVKILSKTDDEIVIRAPNAQGKWAYQFHKGRYLTEITRKLISKQATKQ